MSAWGKLYLAGWTAGALAVQSPQNRLRSEWTLTFGVAIEPFRIGYRAALRAAWGQ